MEASALYTLAAKHGRRALAICTVSDHIVTGEETTAQEREQTFGDMVEIALAAGPRPGLTRAVAGVTRRGDPRRGGDRRRPGRPVGVVPPEAPRHLATSCSTPTTRPGGAWQHRWDSLTMHDVHGIAALPDADSPARPDGRGPTSSCRRTSATTSATTTCRCCGRCGSTRVDRATASLLVVRRRRADLDDPDPRQRDRHLVAAVRAATTRASRRSAASSCTRAAYPGPEHFRGRRVVVVGGGASGGPAARRDRPGRRRHPLGDPARAGVAHRRLHARARPRGGGAGRGAGTPRAAARQRRQRDRAGAARAGAGGRAARRLRAAPDVRRGSSPTACGWPTARSGRPT